MRLDKELLNPAELARLRSPPVRPAMFADLPPPGREPVVVRWPPTWGEWLRARRGAESRRSFAALLGVSVNTLRGWEGGAVPRVDSRAAVDAVLGGVGVDTGAGIGIVQGRAG